MPVDENAAQKYENNARRSRGDYEANATTQAWRAGVEGADSPGQGLSEAGVNNLDVSRFDSAWREGVQEGEYRTDADAWEAGISGDNWLQGMRNGDAWNIG